MQRDARQLGLMRSERERERERERKGEAGEGRVSYCNKPFRNVKRSLKLGVLHTSELVISQPTPTHSFVPLISSRHASLDPRCNHTRHSRRTWLQKLLDPLAATVIKLPYLHECPFSTTCLQQILSYKKCRRNKRCSFKETFCFFSDVEIHPCRGAARRRPHTILLATLEFGHLVLGLCRAGRQHFLFFYQKQISPHFYLYFKRRREGRRGWGRVQFLY